MNDIIMRYHSNYTLFKRGKYYYYQTYDPEGIRQSAKSTHQTSKTAAKLFCEDLIRKGILYSGSKIQFGCYAKGFFDIGSLWIQDRLATGTAEAPGLADATIKKYQDQLRLYIMPFFSEYKLEEINPTSVKKFRQHLIQDNKLAPKSINNIMGTLRTIFNTAMGDSLIMFDPMRGVKPLKIVSKRDSFTMEEARQVLNSSSWISEVSRKCAIIAAVTGMRISEIMALREEILFENYIDVKDQRLKHELKPLKTKEARKVPICPEVHKLIKEIIDMGVLETTRSLNPSEHQNQVLKGMKLDKERGLCFHSWRHFYNTYLLAENITPVKVAAVMGHSTGVSSVQDVYTNFKIEQFKEVVEVQKKLIKLIIYV